MTQAAKGDTPIRILVVDDDSDIRETLRMVLDMMLAGRPHEIVTAANGKEALGLVAEARPSLVLLDLMMPVMSGAEFLDIVQRDDRLVGLPVIVVTAWPRDAKAMRGARAILGKPVDMKDLAEMVEKYIS